jgi:hypothetical protein
MIEAQLLSQSGWLQCVALCLAAAAAAAASLTSLPGPMSASAWPTRPPPMMVKACSTTAATHVSLEALSS